MSTLCFIDTETTGLDPRIHQPYEVCYWLEDQSQPTTLHDVYCEPCGGHRRTFGTRADAQAWLDHHLSTEHGLVMCR